MDKRYLKNVSIYVLSAIVSVLLVAYIVYHLVNSFSQEVETSAANIVTVSETFSTDAYIFRDEKILSSGNPGNVSFMYDDGTMIRKGAAVASVYSGANTDEIKAQVGDLERQISILENSSMVKDVTVSDSTTIDNQIASLYYTIESRLNSGDIDYVFRRKDELLTLLNKRQLLLKIVDSFNPRMAELQSRKTALTTAEGGESEIVYTDYSGYLYSDVDGYESIFTLNAADTFSLEDFYTMINKDPIASTGNSIGKIAINYKWYIACEVPSVHQQYYSVGNTYTVRFPYSADAEVPMDLHRIVTSGDAQSIVLVFSTGSIPDDFNFLRKQSVEIVQQTYTGYRVPVSSVRIIDEKQGVFVKKGNVAVFKQIEPLVEIDGYFIVAEQDKVNDKNYADKLGMYDLIITKGKNLYENKIIQ
ncbi:MAG: hypothetical protein IJA55_05555 [Clostridia bacterium]|nr:hypothetical protein [Clostridia bacterium]MBQ4561770.1 hypothetical protein [Clostridia bacterium]